MLKTPLGFVDVTVDGRAIDYTPVAVPLGRACPDLGGRYAIVVRCDPAQTRTVACRIRGYVPSAHDGPESGEDLELYSYYLGGVKLSLGMEGETAYLAGERLSRYDYDTAYLDDGVQYCLLPGTQTAQFVFGVAWIDAVTAENDIQTWFGADPTLCEFKKITSDKEKP